MKTLLTILFCVLAGVVFAQPMMLNDPNRIPPHAPASGGSIPAPVAWWKMGEGTGTTFADSSGNGYTGSFTSGCTWVTDASYAGILFNGISDYASAGIITQLASAPKASIGGWFYFTSSGAAGGQFGQSGAAYRFSIESDASTCYLIAENTALCYFSFTTSPSIGWHHILLVFDGTQSGSARMAGYI